MCKKQLLLLFGLFISSIAFAQDKQFKIVETFDYQNYSIDLIEKGDGSYGYVVNGAGGKIMQLFQRPYSKKLLGFVKKENALIMAKEHIDLMRRGKDISRFNLNDAKRIGITSDDL